MSEKKERLTAKETGALLWKEADVAVCRDLEYLQYLESLPPPERPDTMPADPISRLYHLWRSR